MLSAYKKNLTDIYNESVRFCVCESISFTWRLGCFAIDQLKYLFKRHTRDLSNLFWRIGPLLDHVLDYDEHTLRIASNLTAGFAALFDTFTQVAHFSPPLSYVSCEWVLHF